MSGGADRRCRYKGVRRRRWGKWVSEIRVPGTRERLWLGSYAAPEAAAVAHDAAACLLRGHGAGTTAGFLLNFPDRAACYAVAARGRPPMSPRSVQRVASDAGMAADAQLLEARERASPVSPARPLVDRVGIGIARCGGHDEREHWPYAATAGSDSAGIASATATSWGTAPRSDGSRSSSADAACELERRLVYGDISVDDIDILM